MSAETAVAMAVGIISLLGSLFAVVRAVGYRAPAALQSALETRVAALERSMAQLATHEYAITTLTKAVERLDGICEKIGDRLETSSARIEMLLARITNGGRTGGN